MTRSTCTQGGTTAIQIAYKLHDYVTKDDALRNNLLLAEHVEYDRRKSTE